MSRLADLSFLAMTQHRLEQGAEAKETLARLREVLKQERWPNRIRGPQSGFLREAEELIEGKAAGQGE
jgi:hypothetical protein